MHNITLNLWTNLCLEAKFSTTYYAISWFFNYLSWIEFIFAKILQFRRVLNGTIIFIKVYFFRENLLQRNGKTSISN
ncbi:Uncharacterized protein XB17_03496 [Leptospira santarosai]|nr:Uncharacterized protein XB17_03496 [Leptospira santarosai]